MATEFQDPCATLPVFATPEEVDHDLCGSFLSLLQALTGFEFTLGRLK